MNKLSFRGRWVLVTGASSGLGRAMAYLLVTEHQANVILVARRGELLRQLSQELQSKAPVSVRVIEADLTLEADVARVYAEATRDVEVYGVVLNAGVTHFGEHSALTPQGFRALLDTNVTSVVQLTSLFAPYLVERGTGGGLLLVSSLAGLTPVPYQSAYSGSKAFLISFAHALRHELRSAHVSVTTFVPGGIATELTTSSGLSQYFKSGVTIMDAEVCARAALWAFERRRAQYVPGVLNRVGVALVRLLPQPLQTAMIGHAYERALAVVRRAAT